MYTTRVRRHVRATPSAVYRALLDPAAIARWRVPGGMSCHVHEFDARQGGTFRVSLSYETPDGVGKSAARTDTYRGHFARLAEDAEVVEVLEFESARPELAGPMTMTTTLAAADGGTDVEIVHEGVPDAVPTAQNELGMRMALDNLAALVEDDPDLCREARPGRRDQGGGSRSSDMPVSSRGRAK